VTVAALGAWLRPGWQVTDWGIFRTLDGVESHCVTIDENGRIRMRLEAFRPCVVSMLTLLNQLARIDALRPEAYEPQEGR
jgi:hypothetical protein